MKTKEELKEQAEKIGLSFWKIHTCSMCGYDCGYVIQGENVGYDSGCDCTYGRGGIQQRSWEELTEAFNRNQPENNPNFKGKHPEAYEKHYAVWKF
jgi:hypothetical protein